MPKYHQNFFKPRNPQKYKGDPTKIFYRSSWELRMMMHLDSHPDVIGWANEEMCVQYKSPIDGKIHRYFPDFVVRQKRSDGKLETVMYEVKPFKETVPPTVQLTGKKQVPSRKYIKEVYTWGINKAKWQAAEKYCEERGWRFCKITEYELGLVKRKNG